MIYSGMSRLQGREYAEKFKAIYTKKNIHRRMMLAWKLEGKKPHMIRIVYSNNKTRYFTAWHGFDVNLSRAENVNHSVVEEMVGLMGLRMRADPNAEKDGKNEEVYRNTSLLCYYVIKMIMTMYPVLLPQDRKYLTMKHIFSSPSTLYGFLFAG